MPCNAGIEKLTKEEHPLKLNVPLTFWKFVSVMVISDVQVLKSRFPPVPFNVDMLIEVQPVQLCDVKLPPMEVSAFAVKLVMSELVWI